WRQVYARRLEASHLGRRAPGGRLLDGLRDVCGLHAQLATGAELAASARVHDVTRDSMRELLYVERALVKANTLRGTLHLHPAGALRRARGGRRRGPSDVRAAGDAVPGRPGARPATALALRRLHHRLPPARPPDPGAEGTDLPSGRRPEPRPARRRPGRGRLD